jgi:MoaA/NifB/PqqE/SkfB family radical SAM enzyme
MRLKEIHISIYGADAETHERISQKKGSFERALKDIKLLTETGVYVGASILLVPFNLYQLEDMVNWPFRCSVTLCGLLLSVL